MLTSLCEKSITIWKIDNWFENYDSYQVMMEL